MHISVIVPALARDAHLLHRTLCALRDVGRDVEIRVATPHHEAPAFARLRDHHGAVRWTDTSLGRAAQMEAAAAGAVGRWLLFLHVDSVLPEGWDREILDHADAHGATWGCFRLALDSADWRARAIEAGVRLRVAACALPYGDQGIFVRRDVFRRVGGFAPLPLMEDVDLVRRLRRVGSPWRSRSPMVTSARRWTRDGWVARSCRNLSLLARYSAGADPARLSAEYDRPATMAVLVPAPSARAVRGAEPHPSEGLVPDVAAAGTVRSLRDVETAVALAPRAMTPEVLADLPPEVDVLPLDVWAEAADLGAAAAAADRRRVAGLVFAPTTCIPSARLLRRAARLISGADRHAVVAIGPAGDCRLIGLPSADGRLLRGLTWHTRGLDGEIVRRADRMGLEVVRLMATD
ncbi:MAG: TIGR04283 family arsenosugar biosynthesis glycosyltransferase [Acidobacteriota bacterium]